MPFVVFLGSYLEVFEQFQDPRMPAVAIGRGPCSELRKYWAQIYAVRILRAVTHGLSSIKLNLSMLPRLPCKVCRRISYAQ